QRLYVCVRVVTMRSVAAQLSARRNKGITKSTSFINSINHQLRHLNMTTKVFRCTENGVNPPACTQCNRHIPLCLSLSPSVSLSLSLSLSSVLLTASLNHSV